MVAFTFAIDDVEESDDDNDVSDPESESDDSDDSSDDFSSDGPKHHENVPEHLPRRRDLAPPWPFTWLLPLPMNAKDNPP